MNFQVILLIDHTIAVANIFVNIHIASASSLNFRRIIDAFLKQCIYHRIIDDRIEKYDAYLRRRFLKVGLPSCNEEFLSRREMDTKGGWFVGAAGLV